MVGSSSNLAMNLDKGGHMITATWRCNYLYLPLQQRVRLQTARHQQAVVVQHLQYNVIQYSTVQYSTVQVIQHLPGHEVSEGEAVPRKPAATMTPQEADTQRAYQVRCCVLS